MNDSPFDKFIKIVIFFKGNYILKFDPHGYFGEGRNLIENIVDNKIKNVLGALDSSKL